MLENVLRKLTGTEWACCICNEKLDAESENTVVLLLRWPAIDKHTTSELWAHGTCLRERLGPDVILLHDLDGKSKT